MIAVLDFGSQYTHLITRRIRELGVSAEIFDHTIDLKNTNNLKGIILSGGPNSIYEKGSPKVGKEILDLNVPILGICYGHQMLATLIGGKVKAGKVREYGEERIKINSKNQLFDGLSKEETVWFSHGDEVTDLPSDYKILAGTKNGEAAAFSSKDGKLLGLQFHPEVHHTKKGKQILKNFLFKVSNTKKDWKINDVKERLIGQIQSEVGKDKVIIGVSGGVDSLVAAKLLDLAIGRNLYCVFIDTGLMRLNESKEVKALFKSMGFKNFIAIDASEKFLTALKKITDPEEKRKVFSKVYFQIFVDVADDLKKKADIKFLAQGTIYPDRIEAGKASKMASVIKTHHNLSLPEKLHLKILEPLQDFYKDEVRSLGKSLDIPDDALNRHPFPGPGLSIRILGEITTERLELLKKADAIFIEELRASGYYQKSWQALAALLPVKSVGVMGDGRTYEYLLALRAVTSVDAMTADWARLPDELLNKVAKRITNEIRGINRVLYDISQKPPATIEYE